MLMNSGKRPVSKYNCMKTRSEKLGKVTLPKRCIKSEAVVAATNGKLDFGPWEQIFYGEFDGRRRKRVLIKIIGE